MKKIIKIITSMLFIILFFTINTYAKYIYQFNLHAFSLERNVDDLNYDIVKSENEYTNKDILLTINFSKPIENIEGFDISEDCKTISKLVKENEKETIKAEDIYGNEKEISYEINNIDKIPPEIIGVEDGGIYNTNVKLDYKDNVGIKEISVVKDSNLIISCHEGFYDRSFYKGIDVTGNRIHIKLIACPINTKYYRYYLNDILKSQIEENEFTYEGLNLGTNYNIKVEAIDENGNILDTVTKNVRTKFFKDMKTEKTENSFKVTLYGIDERVSNVNAIGFTNANNHLNLFPQINQYRNLSVIFYPQNITGTIQEGFYYFHFQFYSANYDTLFDTLGCNVMFKEEDVEQNKEIDKYNLTENGRYYIKVEDLAGNISEKNIVISK